MWYSFAASGDILAKMTDESLEGSVLFGFLEEGPRSGAHQSGAHQSSLQEEEPCGPLVASLE